MQLFGYLPILMKFIKRCCAYSLKIILTTLYFPASVILYLFNIKFIKIYAHAIGHLAVDTTIPLKEKIITRGSTRFIFFHTSKHIANKHLIKYIQLHACFVNNRLLGYLLLPFYWSKISGLNIEEVCISRNQTSKYIEINKNWDTPFFELFDEDINYGQSFLREIGFDNNWFVCLHARDSGFHKSRSSSDFGQEFRNNSIKNYKDAINYILANGGKCIRMGDPSMQKFDDIEGVYDYAHSDLKNDRLDIFLFASCKFSLCSSSGVIELSNLFGVPCAISNIIPISGIVHGISKNVCISKLLYKNGELIPFAEILNQDVGNYRIGSLYSEASIEVAENSSDEILGLVKDLESFNFLDSYKANASTLELEEKFLSLLKPGHYMYGGKARISHYFLKKYQDSIL